MLLRPYITIVIIVKVIFCVRKLYCFKYSLRRQSCFEFDVYVSWVGCQWGVPLFCELICKLGYTINETTGFGIHLHHKDPELEIVECIPMSMINEFTANKCEYTAQF